MLVSKRLATRHASDINSSQSALFSKLFKKFQLTKATVCICCLVLAVWCLWGFYLTEADPWLTIVHNWQISVTMLFGSFVAGATSEGGGAVAFPVFTKLLHVDPQDAKVFSLAIQSVGMTSASLLIILLRIPVDWRVIRWASLGGIGGIILGGIVLAPIISPVITKMLFTVIVTSFVVTLFVLNRGIQLRHQQLPVLGWTERILLILFGFVGGIVSSLVGNGIDIITFSLMVLLFRISEKVATPTSVVLMALNAVVGFLLYLFVLDGFTEQVKAYWLAAVPVVVVGAPLGALLCSKMSRQMIAKMLMGLIAVELISTLLIIQFNTQLIIVSLLAFACLSCVYYLMYRTDFYHRIPIKENNSH
ncbi:MAG: sulfite exporter TauE/SafE family protein [Methylococcales bacterium]